MGILNLIKGKWDGKVGQMVGSKWKDKATLRSYSPPSNPNTAAQQVVRTGFAEISSFVSLFADQIKSLTALNTRGMTVRNAILKLNADMIADGALTVGDLAVSKGGLPLPSGVAVTASEAGNSITATWTRAVGSTITAKAKVVVIAVDKTNNLAFVGSADNTAETLTITATVAAARPLDCYVYLLDYRGSSKVASISQYSQVTPA